MKRSALAVAALLLAAPVLADEIAVTSHDVGHVTLSWQKFNAMWNEMKAMEKRLETLNNPEDHPPVPFTITRAVYQGDVQAHRVVINAIFELDVYEPKKWVKVPFLPASVAIEEARLDGQPVGIMEEDQFHNVVLRLMGRHTLRVRYALKSPKEEEAPHLYFATPSTPMTILAMRFPKPHLAVTIEPSQGVETETSGNTTLVTASIPPTSQIDLRWQKALAPEAEGPSKLYVETNTLFTVAEGAVHGQWTFDYNILHRGVRELAIAVPASWNIISVNCEGLQEWKTRETKDGPVLAIQLAYAHKGNLSVSIAADRGITDKEQVLDIPRLRPVGVEREQGTIGLEARGTVELQMQETPGLSAIDPQELPRNLWNMAAQPVLFAFRYTKPHSLVVSIKRHPEVPVLTTTIDNANAVTLITNRGQMITRIRYEVRNNLKQFLAVQLPAHSQLWSAFVSGQPVKPTQLENGAYRIPLAKSQLEMQGQQGFPVELVYYTPIRRFLPVGYQATAFPVPDAPVSQLLWSMYFPKDYRVAHFGGDMEEGGLYQSLSSIGGLAGIEESNKDDRDEETRYDGLKKKVVGQLQQLATGRALSMPMSKSAIKQAEMVADMVLPANAPTATGVFPVAFEIPATGQLFHFSQVMVVDKNPALSIYYLHAWIVRMFFLLILGGIAAGLYRMRKLISTAARYVVVKLQTLHLPGLIKPATGL